METLQIFNIEEISERLKEISPFIQPEMIWGALAVLAGIFFLITIVLGYHWNTYALRRGEGRLGKLAYILVATLLWLIIGGSALRIMTLIT